ncbi:MAG TPA: alpha/beta fold hydrolase [Symbiobacteriaceae bacterium]|nr:alpha/beta fold hydrolase [Symbiobacteriaceae bacterium]
MRLHFEELGEGFPLVLLHGHTLDRRMWQSTAPGLAAAGYRVIMPDMAGHGLSGPPAADSTPAGDLAELLHELGIGNAVIAGLSLGGAVAINFALRFPELCAALIPIDAALFGHRFAQWQSTKPYIALARSEGLARGLQAWLADPLFARAMASPAAPAIREMVGEYPGHAWLEQAPSPVPPGPLDAVRLGEITAPTLVLTGEHDLPDFRQIGEKLATEIPGAHRRVIPGAGHLTPLEQPAAFTAAVLQFLDDLNRR